MNIKSIVEMKKVLIILVLTLVVTSMSAQEVMKKLSDGTYVVNTTTLANDVDGYQGTTPVEIHIKNDVIVKVVPLKNMETPKHFNRVKKELLTKYEGMSVKKFAQAKVDAVTGATYSSEAVRENVSRGVAYYLKNKKNKK